MSSKEFPALDCTIAASGTTSGEVDLQGNALIGIIMPAAFTGANLKFQRADSSGGTFSAIYDDAGTELSIPCGTSRYIALNNKYLCFAGAQFVKVVSDSAEASARALQLVTRPL